MKRHIVDGAEILRETPDIPALAPVVAFEHHLRLDGTGYPDGVDAAVAQPRHDAVRHRRRLRRDALAARLPAGVSDRSHPRGAAAQRRQAVRSASGAPLRAAGRHLSGRESRAARHRRNRRRAEGLRARSVSARRCACSSIATARGSSCRTTSTCGRPSDGPTRRPIVCAARSRRRTGSTR